MKYAKADETAPQAPQAYSTPQLLVLGQAFNLVQGGDLYKDYVECNGSYRD
jgi:N-acetylglutamate synthase/N-acetylornithine aminotransferase